MHKRTASDSPEFQVLPNTKHAKISDGSVTNLLDDIQFLDFEDEFTASEESIDEQQQSQPSTSGMSSATDSQQSDFLDLSSWKRCTVERCERDARTKDLIIYGHEDPIRNNPNRKSTDDDSDDGASIATEHLSMQCRLQHFWSQCRIEAGDIISIIAVWNVELQSYCVTNADGLIVVRPDFLVSGTTVVGGLFCMRKAVLQDRFKGIETGIKIVSMARF